MIQASCVIVLNNLKWGLLCLPLVQSANSGFSGKRLAWWMIINSSKQCIPSSPANLGLQHISLASRDYHWIWQVTSLELSAPGQCMALQASGYGGGRECWWEREGCVHQLLKTVAELTSVFSLEELGFQNSSSLPSLLLALDLIKWPKAS